MGAPVQGRMLLMPVTPQRLCRVRHDYKFPGGMPPTAGICGPGAAQRSSAFFIFCNELSIIYLEEMLGGVYLRDTGEYRNPETRC